MVGIDKTKEVMSTMAELVSNCVELSKDGITFTNFGKIISILSEINTIAHSFAPTIIEMKDLDANESAELGKLSFVLVQKVLVGLLDK
jgi:hypothetical protein